MGAIASKSPHLKLPGEKQKDEIVGSFSSQTSESYHRGSTIGAVSARSLSTFDESNSARTRYNSVTSHSFSSDDCGGSSAEAVVEESLKSIPEVTDPKSSNRRVSFRPPSGETPPRKDCDGHHQQQQVTYRERLGGYLHPRDMRRLVTPFSASNEPELIVRRHVMLLNFDPLRAIVLRDRLLVLVPDGADSILESLANRIKGGLQDMEDAVFGTEHHNHSNSNHAAAIHKAVRESPHNRGRSNHKRASDASNSSKSKYKRSSSKSPTRPGRSERRGSGSGISSDDDDDDDETESIDFFDDDEWGDLQGKEWIDLPFELQSVDAVLHTVSLMLTDEANDLQEYAYMAVEQMLDSNHASAMGDGGGGGSGHDVLRSVKGEISQMVGRVQGFIRAINLVLDDDEDLALMNLSRLITHPERFIQPVSQEILHEESDEPELILEAYLQQSLSNTNALELLKQEVAGSEELMNMKLDTVRNRLLYINTVVSLLTLVVGIGSFIGAIFGMNLLNGLEEDPHAFKHVVLGTCFGALGLLVLLVVVFYRASTMPKMTGS